MFAENQYDTAVPIYLQIIERIEQKLVTGEWRAGERVPAVRELAAEFGVNPNTMQRALAELERSGLVYSERTAGRFVTPDEQRIRRLREEKSDEVVRDFLRRMTQMGCTREEVLRLLEKHSAPPDGGEQTKTKG